jgi:hypothetical protein
MAAIALIVCLMIAAFDQISLIAMFSFLLVVIGATNFPLLSVKKPGNAYRIVKPISIS